MNIQSKLQKAQNKYRRERAKAERERLKAERVLANQLQFCLMSWAETGQVKSFQINTSAPKPKAPKPTAPKPTPAAPKAVQEELNFRLNINARLAEPTQAGLIANLILEDLKRTACPEYKRRAEEQEALDLEAEFQAELAEEGYTESEMEIEDDFERHTAFGERIDAENEPF